METFGRPFRRGHPVTIAERNAPNEPNCETRLIDRTNPILAWGVAPNEPNFGDRGILRNEPNFGTGYCDKRTYVLSGGSSFVGEAIVSTREI
ncbi:MAG: hypothetical protein ABS79_04565 [Planctomycetes bacterium SCN 63-9]|nr:MAG: hypothetical protein ABS79_04565 [Planctomycetes bacterium SCN 63-9]